MQRMKVVCKTWDEFWGELFLVRFHVDNPERWPSRQRKADWLSDTLKLKPNSSLLELGCGDGLVSICLARSGHDVVAIDRIASVLELAKQDDDTGKVSFLAEDIRSYQLPETSYDAVFMLETIGLMDRDDDLALLKNVHKSLRTGGIFAFDCPKAPSNAESSWVKEFSDGKLEVKIQFELSSRLIRIIPTYTSSDGTVTSLYDPYSAEHQGDEGVTRYYYPEEELMAMVKEAGFAVELKPHLSEESYYLLVATKA